MTRKQELQATAGTGTAATAAAELAAQSAAAASHENACEALLHAAAYSAVQAPADGIAQLADHMFGTHLDKAVHRLDAQTPGAFLSLNWQARQIGAALGMLPWVLALNKGLAAGAGKILGDQALGLGSRLCVSATTGLIYGGLLTPTDGQSGNWAANRAISAGTSAATFATLTGTAGKLEALGTNRIAAGLLSGLPAGFVSAEIESLLSRQKPASGQDVAYQMGTFAYLGGLMSAFGPPQTASQEQAPKAGREIAYAAMREPASEPTRPADTAVAATAKEPTGYTGYFLTDEASRHVLSGLTIDGQQVPVRWRVPDRLHVTQEFGIKESAGDTWAHTGDPPRVRVIGYALDNTGVEALHVAVDGKTTKADGHPYHLTRSLAEGRKAAESNTVVEKALSAQPGRTPGAAVSAGDSQRYSYVALKPEEQFDLAYDRRFEPTETTAPKPKKASAPKPEQPFESLPPRLQVISALKATPPDYLDRTIATRTPEQRAGSYFEMPPDRLRQQLYQAQWERYNPLDESGRPLIGGGAIGFRATIPGGRLGMIPLADVPERAQLYLIDPKGLNTWSVSTVGAAEPKTDTVTMIVGKDEGGQKNIVWTFHPGDPVRPSMLDSQRLQTVLAGSGISTEGLPESGPGRRIPISRSQLDQINAQLPADQKMDLAKIESQHNLPHEQALQQTIPNLADRLAFQREMDRLPANQRGRFVEELRRTSGNRDDVRRTTSIRGIIFEMSRINRTLNQGLEAVSADRTSTGAIDYQGYGKDTHDFSLPPYATKHSAIQLNVPLVREGGKPYAYEVKSSPRQAYGSEPEQRNQILKFQQAISQGTIAGATVEVSGRVSPDLVSWLNGRHVGDAVAAPDVEVLYTMPLPSGAEYTFVLKRAANGNGLSFVNDDRACTADDRKIVTGVFKAINDRSIGEIIAGSDPENAPAELRDRLQDPMSISDLSLFNKYDQFRLGSMWDKFRQKADSERINSANARNAVSEYNTRDYIDEATRWYQDYLKQNPQSLKAKQAYLLPSEEAIERVVDLTYQRAQAIRNFEIDRAASPSEVAARLQRARLGYEGRPEGVSLDMEHLIMDATQEENKGGSRRGRTYDQPERFMGVQQVLDYLSDKDNRLIDVQVFDPATGKAESRSVTSDREVGRMQRALELENLDRAKARIAANQERFEELRGRSDLTPAESEELRQLARRNAGFNVHKGAIAGLESKIETLARERKMPGAARDLGAMSKDERQAAVEQMKQRSARYDEQIAALRTQLQRRLTEVLGGQGEWNKIAKQLSTQEQNIAKFMYVVTADGRVPVAEEVLRGPVTGRPAHSELAQGRNVYGAGELVFSKDPQSGDWSLIEINNASGHYRPGSGTLAYVKNAVAGQGIDTSKAILNDALQRGTPLVDAHLLDYNNR